MQKMPQALRREREVPLQKVALLQVLRVRYGLRFVQLQPEEKIMKKLIFFVIFCLFAFGAQNASAHQPRVIYFEQGDIFVENPELSQAFYDELKGQPRNYFIESGADFNLYINLLVPLPENRNGRYSAKVFSGDKEIAFIDGTSVEWQELYEEFGRDYYLKGPEFDQKVPAGKYRIEVFSDGNTGKYVLAIGKTEFFDAKTLLNVYWQLPLLKIQFFKTSPLQFFLTPFGIGGIAVVGAVLIFLAIVYYLIGVITAAIRHRQAKTLLLTSAGMAMKEEIMGLLQKPAYNITVAFIITAAKPEGNQDYVQKDWLIMKEEMGFNIEEVDIEGKNESQVTKLLELKDIIFVEGGNTFYLLKAMRACNFGKIIRKLLKEGKVYIGASAGSIVAGRTIKTADRLGTGSRDRFGVGNLKGLNLVNFDIVPHYTPEMADVIKKKFPWKWQRKRLRIITDEQAILVQGKEVSLIGQGEQVVI